MNVDSTTIIRVTKTEFETKDGCVFQMPFELENEITVPEFQKIYDDWLRTIQQKVLTNTDAEEINN